MLKTANDSSLVGALIAGALSVLAAMTSLGCSSPTSTGSTQQPASATSTAADQKAEALQATTQAGPASADMVAAPAAPLPTGKGLINAQYNISAKALGMNICQGTMQLQVNAALTTATTSQLLQVPQGAVKCSILGSIDLSTILGAISQAPASANPITISDNVIGLNQLGPATYTPPRPLLPSFLASSASALATLNVSRVVQISTGGVNDSGTSAIVMQSFDQPFTSTLLNQTFPHTMDFIVTNTGYSKVDQVANFIFDSMEFKISTNPVSIVSIAFSGKMKAVASAAAQAPGAATGIIGAVGTDIANNPNGFFGTIAGWMTLTMTLDLAEQDGLAAETAASASSDNLGEQIGGQATGS